MSTDNIAVSFSELLQQKLATDLLCLHQAQGEITIEVAPTAILKVAQQLRDDPAFRFEALMDVCAVDYLYYGIDEWKTDKATETTFDRGVEKDRQLRVIAFDKPRFAVVYHLLSYTHRHRLRVKVFLPETELMLPSVIDIWPAANWFEREAFDLYGILFTGHPDLRRILTDYGFIGHPFRKDFPLSGTVEVRYDAAQKRVIYEPVEIVPRVLTPKVIREDNRYLSEKENAHG